MNDRPITRQVISGLAYVCKLPRCSSKGMQLNSSLIAYVSGSKNSAALIGLKSRWTRKISGPCFSPRYRQRITFMMAFSYQTLKRNQIRLLHRIGGTHDRDLRFRLVHTSINQKPHYTAISYTWGSESATERIFIDDKLAMVSPNLWAGLHILRRSWQLVWVDAVYT